MVSPLDPWPPVCFGGPGPVRKPGGVRTKGREKLLVASPPPASPPPPLARSLLIQTSARSCGVSSVPAAAERGNGRGAGAAGKGGAPPPAPGPRGRPPAPPSGLRARYLAPSPDGRPARAPVPTRLRSSRAPPPHPARAGSASPSHTREAAELAGGGGAAWGCVGAPRKVGWRRGAGLPTRPRGAAAGAGSPTVAREGPGKLATAKTMRPNRRPPQTMAGTVHPGRRRARPPGSGEGPGRAPDPHAHPRETPPPPGAPNPCPGVPVFSYLRRRRAGLCFLGVKRGFLFTPFNFKD